jgi:general secretion pathway protein H
VREGEESRPHHAACRGFTLIEMLVVLTVVGLLASLAPMAFERLSPGLRLEAAARELADTLREARGLAIRDNRPWFVEIDVDANVARLGPDGRAQALPDDVQLSLTVATVEREGSDAGRIRFYPDGTSTGGEIAFTAGERTLVVVVDWFDGKVRLTDRPPA